MRLIISEDLTTAHSYVNKESILQPCLREAERRPLTDEEEKIRRRRLMHSHLSQHNVTSPQQGGVPVNGILFSQN